nr:immunoglobulin heavy chain junction region [Macaca mulatta]MOW50288.1 immunoglobulin heavy chain junction region [Macaca mulatta]MOW50385.1 immunoglobulin heavy chain junction region [Macaca mulatta]
CVRDDSGSGFDYW